MKLILMLIALVVPQAFSATLVSDGSRDDVQAKIDAAADGDIVEIPSGSFTWTSGVTITGKGIHLKGAGGGRVEGSSVTSLAIGTGTKAFTIQTGSVVSSGWTVGETVRANVKYNGSNYMEGTVSSWDGTTLTLNVTSTGGSGTFAGWTMEMPATTTITHNFNGTLIALTQDTTNAVELSGVRLKQGTAVAGTGVALIRVSPAVGGKQVLIHDLRTSTTGNTSERHLLIDFSGGVIIWRMYLDTGFSWGGLTNCPGYGIAAKENSGTSWDAVSTMGTNDSTGLNNHYVENCYFQGFFTEAFDWDDNSKGVVRYSAFDNSGGTSHGNDTSPIGLRHLEIYNNYWFFADFGANTANVNYAIWYRGGTGVLTGNVIPDITSIEWGDKPEIRVDVIGLQRGTGWAYGQAGVQYHYPRQFGFGRVTGSGVDGLGNTTSGGYYVGDIEPFYQWSNSGGGNYASPYLADDDPGDSNEDSIADYVRVGTEYINSTKSGWTAYTYPHPLRGAATGTTTITGTLTVTGTITLE